MHHKHLGKEEGECFGMLWVPMRYFKDALKRKDGNKNTTVNNVVSPIITVCLAFLLNNYPLLIL